jgi:2-methylcitrate dehydratase PrpD
MKSELRLIEFIRTLQLDDVDDSATMVARRVFGGTLATAAAGALEEGIAPLRKLLTARAGTPTATSFIYGDRLPATSAALLNATMARALDYCDAMAPGVHVGSSVVPAALAMAEQTGGCSGEEFFRAVIIGCEVAARFNLTEDMYDGFDPTGVATVFGATAAAGVVARLDDEQMHHALGLALNRCGGSYQSNVDASLAVRLQQGIVALSAIESVELAAVGITGPANFLDGVYGYAHLFARDRRVAWDFVEGLGDDWKITGFMFKKFPSCGATQGVTQLALDMGRDLTIGRDDVERVLVTLPPYCHRLVGNPFSIGPNPRVSAQFSVQYCVANALSRGTAGLRDFSPAAVRDPQLSRLIDIVEVVADPALDRRGHSAVDIEIVLRDGRRERRGFDTSPGYPGNDLTDDDHRRRFDECMAYASLALAPGAVEQLRTFVARVEHEDDISRCLDLLRSPQAV